MTARWNCSQISTPQYNYPAQENEEPELHDYANLIKQKDEQISCLKLLLNDVRETCASGRREPPPAELVRLTTEADLLRQTKEALKQQIVALQEEFARTCEEFDAQLAILNEEVILREEENKRLTAMLKTIASKEETGTQHESSGARQVVETQRLQSRPCVSSKRRRMCLVQRVASSKPRRRLGWQWDVCRVQIRGRPDLGFSNAVHELSVSHMSLPIPQRQPSRLLQSVTRESSRMSRSRRDAPYRDETLWPGAEAENMRREGRLIRDSRMAPRSSSRASSVGLRAPLTEGVKRSALMLTAEDIRRWLD